MENSKMKTRKFIIAAAFTVLLFFNSNKLFAQFDQMFTQFMHNEMFVNPAYAGAKEALAVTLLHRQQWVGFEGRPITTTFSINSPVMRESMGVGLSYLNEKIGVLNRNIIYASYAYRIRVNDRGYLHFGLMGGVHLQLNKVSELKPITGGDPHFTSNLPTVATPNFGFGLYYNTDKFYASFSIPRLLDDHVKFSADGLREKAVHFRLKSFHYYLAAGRIFTINNDLKLKPHIMMKATANSPVEFDVNISALIMEKLWAGLAYRSSADVSAMVGVQITPAFLASYSYDYQTTRIHEFSGGSHEIVLSYVFAYNSKKIISPRYF
jgi:type IX secretion system PorP/SprF family membrane protein